MTSKYQHQSKRANGASPARFVSKSPNGASPALPVPPRAIASRVTLIVRGEGTRRVRISADGEDARATGRCPECDRKPLDVLGRYCVVSDDCRSFIAEAVAQCCGAVIGYLQQFPALKRGELLELETT